ncbi:putative type II DNA topoisomerase [Betaentomopoxvirus amoorei]|uniref:AMV022 n=1 Tax=Amsacta moorei entomopoxvirus TaxID=28321 RepID=Q9EN26_AMEPV|nr:putative type II DNA topoisomerase [Amsacta moorei entomopoxvirus]AAG02728.1 AMV022 [Amsacta moorei entomopoxvirus]
MFDFVSKYKFKFNNFIDNLKFKNIKKCSAIVYNKQCNNITKYKYCNAHYNIMKEYCKLYHYWDNQHSYPSVSLIDLIEVEIEMRNKYIYNFNIISDYAHDKWLNFLQSQKDKYTYKYNYLSYYNILDDILYNKIDNYNLKYIDYLNLEVKIDNNVSKISEIKINIPSKYKIYNDYYNNNIYRYNYDDKRKSM